VANHYKSGAYTDSKTQEGLLVHSRGILSQIGTEVECQFALLKPAGDNPSIPGHCQVGHVQGMPPGMMGG